jgi:hypothetical protein
MDLYVFDNPYSYGSLAEMIKPILSTKIFGIGM